MISAKLQINTKFIYIDSNHVYCAYCGKEISPDTEIDHHEVTNFYHCDCPDALKDIEIQQEINHHRAEIDKLSSSFPAPKYKVVALKPEIQKI